MKNVLKKLVKRASAMVLAVLCVTALCTGALAEEGGTPSLNGASTDTTNITVNLSVDGQPVNDEVAAYRLIDISWDKDANTVERVWNNDFKQYFADKDNGSELTVDEYTKLPEDKQKEILSGLYEYIKDTYLKNNTSATKFPDPLGGWHKAENGVATITGNTTGAYLIVPKNTSYVYNANLVILEPTEENGEYVLKPVTLNAKIGKVGITKTVDEESKTVGKDIKYTVVASLPTSIETPNDAVCEISDNPDANKIKIDKDSIKVYKTSSMSPTDDSYTEVNNLGSLITNNDNGFKLALSKDNLSSQEWRAVTYIKIEYKAKLADKADLAAGTAGSRLANENTASYIYKRDNENRETKIDSTAKVYTYGIELTKKGENGQTLKGAEFKIYSDAECKTPVFTGDYESKNTVITGEDGKATFERLAAGTYYLKETKAPTGYNKLTEPIEIVVSDTAAGEDGYVKRDITNSKGGSPILPTTGGVSRLILSIGGLMAMCAAAIMLVVYMRSNKSKTNE